jgi:DNA-binding MarR family transcriptional regulator
MANAISKDDLPRILRESIVGLVRLDVADLTLRQLGVFLKCYLDEGSHTATGLARELNVGKPAITRALDSLEEFDLARRKVDPSDRRRIFVGRTAKGAAFLRELWGMIERAAVRPVAARV